MTATQLLTLLEIRVGGEPDTRRVTTEADLLFLEENHLIYSRSPDFAGDSWRYITTNHGDKTIEAVLYLLRRT